MQMAGDRMSESQEKPIDSIINFKEFLETKKDSISKLTQEVPRSGRLTKHSLSQ